MSDTESATKRQKTGDLYPEMDYFMNEEKSDVIFIVNGHRVPARKDTLVLGCVYFRNMFGGDYVENVLKEIEIKDTPHEAFKAVIWYLYSHQLSFKDDQQMDETLVSDVLRLADAYQMPRLILKVEQYLKKRVSMDNLVYVSTIASNYRLEDLCQRVKLFIDDHYSQLILKDVQYLSQMNSNTDGYLMQKMKPSAILMDKYPGKKSGNNWAVSTYSAGYYLTN